MFMDSSNTECTFDGDVQQPHAAVTMALDMPEILEKIFSYLVEYKPKDLISAALVCRKWRDAAYHPSLWRHHEVCMVLKPSDTVQLLPSLARRRIRTISVRGLQTHMRDLLPSLPSLKELSIGRLPTVGQIYHRVTDMRLHEALQQRHTALTSLSLCNCKKITDASVILLSSTLPNLEILNLTRCKKVTDVGLMAVARNLPQLHDLSVDHCAITDAGVAALAGRGPEVSHGTPMLNGLCMAKCKITDTALQHISIGLPKMRYLKVSGCRKLTDAGLHHLVNMEALSYLALERCKRITEEGPKRLSYLEKGRVDWEYRRSEKYGLVTFRSFVKNGYTFTYQC